MARFLRGVGHGVAILGVGLVALYFASATGPRDTEALRGVTMIALVVGAPLVLLGSLIYAMLGARR